MRKVYLVLAESDAREGAQLAREIESSLIDCELICPALPGYGDGERSWWTAHAVVGLVTEAALVEADVPFALGGAHAAEKPVFAVLGPRVVREALTWPMPPEALADLEDPESMDQLIVRLAQVLGVPLAAPAHAVADAVPDTAPMPEAPVLDAPTDLGSRTPAWATDPTPTTTAVDEPAVSDATRSLAATPLVAATPAREPVSPVEPAAQAEPEAQPSLSHQPTALAQPGPLSAWGEPEGVNTPAVATPVMTSTALPMDEPTAPAATAVGPEQNIADAIRDALASTAADDTSSMGADTLLGMDSPGLAAADIEPPLPDPAPLAPQLEPEDATDSDAAEALATQSPSTPEAIGANVDPAPLEPVLQAVPTATAEIDAPAQVSTPSDGGALIAQLSEVPAPVSADQTAPGWPMGGLMRTSDATSLPDAPDSVAPRAIPTRSDIAPAPSILTAAPGCEASLEAGRAFADCIFHRDERADFTQELDVPFGNFVTALGGNWGTLRALDDIDLWMEMADNVLSALPDERYYVRLWYEVGFQLSTLLNLANLDESDSGDSGIDDTWNEAMSALTEAADQLGMGAGQVAVVEGMLENLRGPSSERDYLNIGRVEAAIRQHANHADAALSA